jgi:hypothetical protein
MSWRKTVLTEFAIELSRLYVVEDPDSLLSESLIQEEIQKQGFDVVHFEESVSFRYWYEGHVRGAFLAHRETSSQAIIVVIDGESIKARDLPFDIVSQARVCALSLNTCFPDLFYSVIKLLQPEELDALDVALQHYTPGKLGDISSRDFVLRHVYQIAPEVIKTPSDLLRTLLRTHYRDIAIPLVLKNRVVQLLDWRKEFTHWPLHDIVANGSAFFAFIQQHWLTYINAVLLGLSNGIEEPEAEYSSAEQLVLPFGHDDVRIYIDNLFLEGFLQPIENPQSDKLKDHWCIVGIQQDTVSHAKQRANGLLALCKEELPNSESRHQAWLQFAHRWAELVAIRHSQPDVVDLGAFEETQAQMDSGFTEWMLQRFGALANHPPIPPAMLHHIPRTMARQIEQDAQQKVALILVDGLAIDQWVTLRDTVQKQFDVSGWLTHESATFAWVPTVTSVSRQALFSGKAPYQFPKSIHTTSSEEKLWRQFWMDYGVVGPQVFYQKSLGIGSPNEIIETLTDHRIRAAGLVINTVDDIMHGMMLGTSGMHNQVSQWAGQGYLYLLVQALLENGFKVYLTSDHGNIEAQGRGKINDGVTADSRGERVRVYPNELLRETIKEKQPDTVDWPNYGLPTDYWALMSNGRTAFVSKGDSVVGHGGIALEEVIVPYVTIEKAL